MQSRCTLVTTTATSYAAHSSPCSTVPQSSHVFRQFHFCLRTLHPRVFVTQVSVFYVFVLVNANNLSVVFCDLFCVVFLCVYGMLRLVFFVFCDSGRSCCFLSSLVDWYCQHLQIGTMFSII